MATVWIGEDDFNRNNVVEYKDLQASAMAVDCLGQWALLGGKRLLGLVDLNRPREMVKRIPRQSKYEVSCVQWNHHASHANLFATASNQRTDICSWSKQQASTYCTLKAHTRVISDVDWSYFDVNILATCSVDTYIYLWDIRDSKKPLANFQTVAGASQVKWNKVTNNLFASAHEADVRLWDQRKGNSPTQYIAAHLSKIHGLDWNPGDQDKLATSSQDGTVKFWDIRNPRKPESTISSLGYPVWRARYTPFGHGMITVVVPQLRRGENSLFLWDTHNLQQYVHAFVGHTDVVLEFEWRKRAEESTDYWLVTWSRDQTLRTWKIDHHIQRVCGHDVPAGELLSRETTPAVTNPPQSRSSGEITVSSAQQPCTLQQEFTLVNLKIANINVDEMDVSSRRCVVSSQSGKHTVTLEMDFPVNYPYNVAPTFTIHLGTSLQPKSQQELLQSLQETSEEYVKRNRSCVEPCLRQFVAVLDRFMTEEKSPDTDLSYNPPTNTLPVSPFYNYCSLQDDVIPFPRTSGARFCSAGYLVWFARPLNMKRVSGRDTDVTPRDLSALSEFIEFPSSLNQQPFQLFTNTTPSPPSSSNEPVSISNFYVYKEKKARPKNRMKSKNATVKHEGSKQKESKVSAVEVYDISALLPIHRHLGEKYLLDTDNIEDMCAHNASVAAEIGREDLVQLWSLVSHTNQCSCDPHPDPDIETPWAMQPFGRALVTRLFDHYMSIFDVQTVAMLCCVFWTKEHTALVHTQISSHRSTPVESTSPNIDVSPPWSEMTVKEIDFVRMNSTPLSNVLRRSLSATTKLRRSSSWSESYEYYGYADETKDSSENEKEVHLKNCRLLDIRNYHQYDTIKRKYADILYRWGLRNQCTKVLKYITQPADGHKGIEFGVICHNCGCEVRGAQCSSCKNLAFQCVICHTGVKGASNFCLWCGHGGHSRHMLNWFVSHEVCPSGCGCRCLDNSLVSE